MDFTLNLIRTVRQLELLEGIVETPVSEGVKAVLREVMEDSCRYVSHVYSFHRMHACDDDDDDDEWVHMGGKCAID